MDVTQIVLARFGERRGAAEWAAAVAHHAGPEGLKQHLAQWVDEVDAINPFYGLLLRAALEEVDYGWVARVLMEAWPEFGEDFQG